MRPSRAWRSAAGPACPCTIWNCWRSCHCRPAPPHHRPAAWAGTTHRCSWLSFSRPMFLVGASTVTVRSGVHSPMSQSCDTRRVPGLSPSRAGRNCRFTAGSRYMVMTLAAVRSVLNRSCSRNSARSATPAAWALRRLRSTNSGTISTPRPRAPKRRAAVMTMRPSPEPRSSTKSFAFTPASSSMETVTLSGVVMKGTSSITGMGARPCAEAFAHTAAVHTSVLSHRPGTGPASGQVPCRPRWCSDALVILGIVQAKCHGCFRRVRYLPAMPSNSTSKYSVAFGGIGPPGVPRSP